MKRLTLLVLAAWLLVVALVGTMAVREASAAQPQGVSRPAPGVSRPVLPAKTITPKERRRILKARVVHLREKISKAEQRVAKARNEKRKRVLNLKVNGLRTRLARLLWIERHLSRSLHRKR